MIFFTDSIRLLPNFFFCFGWEFSFSLLPSELDLIGFTKDFDIFFLLSILGVFNGDFGLSVFRPSLLAVVSSLGISFCFFKIDL